MEKNIRRYFALFALPTLLAFLIAFVIPFIMGMYLSFTEFRTVNDAHFVGISNYIKAFSADSEFLSSLWFTVKFSLVAVLSINLFAFVIALMLTGGIYGTGKDISLTSGTITATTGDGIQGVNGTIELSNIDIEAGGSGITASATETGFSFFS